MKKISTEMKVFIICLAVVPIVLLAGGEAVEFMSLYKKKDHLDYLFQGKSGGRLVYSFRDCEVEEDWNSVSLFGWQAELLGWETANENYKDRPTGKAGGY